MLALALVTAAVVTSRSRRQREVRLGGAAAVLSLVVLAAAWQGAASQAATWAQVPYLASGGLLAVVLALIAMTLGVAPVLAAATRYRARRA